MSAPWKIGVIGLLFLFAAVVSIFYSNVFFFGVFIALFLISLSGAYFATLFNKGNRATAASNARQVKARQTSGYTQERIRQRAEEDRGKRQRGS
jgi:hypothetical protein